MRLRAVITAALVLPAACAWSAGTAQSPAVAWTKYAAGLDDAFFATDEAARIAGNVLDRQLDSGGWPKNVAMQNVLSPEEREEALSHKGERKLGTIDNAATTTEIRYLARVYKARAGRGGDALAGKCLKGVEKGVRFMLDLQYQNGGWPQFDPVKVGYWHQITYNDDAMVNVMKVVREIGEAKAPFDLPLAEALRERCRRAFDRGVKCILDTQIRQNGKLTLWCQQHDRDTLEPCIGRSFELPSICSQESGNIVLLLMSLDATRYPPETARRLRESVEGAVAWYKANALYGLKIEENWRRDDGVVTSRLVRVPPDESKPLWCRYYTLEENRPFTGRRDSTKNFDFSELERGENMSYKWFNDMGSRVISVYEKWRIENASAAAPAAAVPPSGGLVLRCGRGESLQKVLDSIPEGAERETTVKVAPGRYREKIRLAGRRSRIRLVAEDPRPGKTVISWNDTPATTGANGKPLGTSGSSTLRIEIPDFEMAGFTVENTGTPERLAATGGREQAGQCVALYVSGDRCVFRRCRFLGWQDTVFAGGSAGGAASRQVFDECYIEGTVDFIFGGSVALFWKCDIHSIDGGYVTAGSHTADMPFGYVFARCRVTCGNGKRTHLGRPWRPYANVTFIDTDFGDAVSPEGWRDWTTDEGRRVWRSAEYACRQNGETKRDAIVEVGGAAELRERLRSAGCTGIKDIVKGADGWSPLKNR